MLPFLGYTGSKPSPPPHFSKRLTPKSWAILVKMRNQDTKRKKQKEQTIRKEEENVNITR
jgi:hypothetical protein